VIEVRWEAGVRSLPAECARALRQPERLLSDPRLLAAPVEEWEEVVLSGGLRLERRGPGRWGPRGEEGELPAAPGVWRYLYRIEARERLEGVTPPADALTLTVRGRWGEDTLALWEDAGGWRARSGHTGASVRAEGPARGVAADLRRLIRQTQQGALARPQLSDPDHAVGGR
jgi:hypothetical protein